MTTAEPSAAPRRSSSTPPPTERGKPSYIFEYFCVYLFQAETGGARVRHQKSTQCTYCWCPPFSSPLLYSHACIVRTCVLQMSGLFCDPVGGFIPPAFVSFLGVVSTVNKILTSPTARTTSQRAHNPPRACTQHTWQQQPTPPHALPFLSFFIAPLRRMTQRAGSGGHAGPARSGGVPGRGDMAEGGALGRRATPEDDGACRLPGNTTAIAKLFCVCIGSFEFADFISIAPI